MSRRKNALLSTALGIATIVALSACKEHPRSDYPFYAYPDTAIRISSEGSPLSEQDSPPSTGFDVELESGRCIAIRPGLRYLSKDYDSLQKAVKGHLPIRVGGDSFIFANRYPWNPTSQCLLINDLSVDYGKGLIRIPGKNPLSEKFDL